MTRTLILSLTVAAACTVPNPAPPTPGSPPPDAGMAADPPTSDFDASTPDPLAGCHEVAIEPTVTWTCGPHTVVLATYDRGLPPDSEGTWRGGEPTVEPVDVPVQGRVIPGRVMRQPAIDTSPHRVTVLVRDEQRGRVASCAVRIAPGQAENLLQSWCVRALGRALDRP